MMSIQVMQLHNEEIGSPAEKCTTAAITPAPAGMGMPTKYFFPGRPGFDGCGFFAILNRARRLAPAIKKAKQAIDPSWMIFKCRSGLMNAVGRRWKPHIHASNAGAT